MSFKGILDVAVFLERFRNIDLYQQGLYCIRLTLVHRVKTTMVKAHPYDCFKGQALDSNALHMLLSPRIDEAEQAFLSSAFLIRYTEEEAVLRESCVFRLETDPAGLDSEAEIVLNCELLYSELDGDLDPASLPSRLPALSNSLTFKHFSTVTFKLQRPHCGLHEFLPLVFDEMHRCSVIGSVHSVLMEFILRNHGDRLGRAQTVGDGEGDLPKRLAKLLFTDKRKRPKLYIGAGETDDVYKLYVGLLARGHEYLRNMLARMIGKSLPRSQLMEDVIIPEPLSLPFLRSPEGLVVGKFSEAISTHDPVAVSAVLLQEISLVASQVFHMFHILLKVIKVYPVHFLRPLMDRYYERLRERYSRCVFKEVRRAKDHPIVAFAGLETSQKSIANDRRRTPTSQVTDSFPLEIMGKPIDLPIIFEETYVSEALGEVTALPNSQRSLEDLSEPVFEPVAPKETPDNEKYLFVLVHGFQGRSFDVHLLKHAISLVNPDAMILASNANENNTEGDIFDMGEKLAAEVKAYILEWFPRNKLSKLSFLGHSLGGLIIRTALPHLSDYAGKMHLFLTLSTPHLGYMYNSSKIIDAGIWVLRKWKRSTALQQLSMNDDEEVNKTALFSMSDCAGLRWFRYVVFCSSFQDQYVPHDSARVEVSEAGANDPTRGRFYIQMASKILSNIAIERLHRLDVNFHLRGKSLDTLIGRTAHIQFLENEQFLHMLVHMYPEFFHRESPVSDS